MRRVFTHQRASRLSRISEIRFNPEDCDDIPVFLQGLQSVYINERSRKEIFDTLDRHVRPKLGKRSEHPGVTLWRILVLSVLIYGLNCSLDRLLNLANNHRQVREMLLCEEFGGGEEFDMNTLINDLKLLPEEAWWEISDAVAVRGQRLEEYDA